MPRFTAAICMLKRSMASTKQPKNRFIEYTGFFFSLPWRSQNAIESLYWVWIEQNIAVSYWKSGKPISELHQALENFVKFCEMIFCLQNDFWQNILHLISLSIQKINIQISMTKTFLSHRNWVERDFRWTNCDTVRIWYVNLEEKLSGRNKKWKLWSNWTWTQKLSQSIPFRFAKAILIS